jgi:hypothetical protein
MGLTTEFINALKELGDGRYHYWDGQTGIGCSDYVRLALGNAKVITVKEALSSDSLWAGQKKRGVLADGKRFEYLPPTTEKKDGDILWYHGAHVAVYYKGGVFEAAPESTHPLSDNKKTGVGLYSKHGYNCAGIPLSNIYRIIEVQKVEKDMKMITWDTLIDRAIKLCMGKYGKTAYINKYPYNVGKWESEQWSFDCLGFVHTLVNGFVGNRNLLGGGAIMDEFVNCCDEAATLKTCENISKFTGASLKKGELLQSSGHVGLYIGDYEVPRSDRSIDVYNTAECTPAWGGGCVLSWTDINTGYRYNKKGGQYRSIWNYHGELGRVDYAGQDKTVIMEEPVEEPTKECDPKTALQLAIECIDGKHGNNPERREQFIKLYGSDWAIKIQELINLAYK